TRRFQSFGARTIQHLAGGRGSGACGHSVDAPAGCGNPGESIRSHSPADRRPGRAIRGKQEKDERTRPAVRCQWQPDRPPPAGGCKETASKGILTRLLLGVQRMRPNRGRACAVAVTFFCLSSFSATAADPSCPNPAVPLSVLLMPPPKPDSPQTKAELQELQRLQESRTPEQIKHVRDDDHRTLERFLGGIGVKVENLSESARRFFDCIDASVRHSVHEAKNTFD